jgi:hypothetical protein
MPLTLEKQGISLRDIINRLSPYPEILREVDRGEEAENLDCLIEDIKNELIKEL